MSKTTSFMSQGKIIIVMMSLNYHAFQIIDVEVVEGKGGNYKFVEEDNVLILTRDNFHYYVMSRPNVLVEFYAPW